jgi:hypothetical protein
MVGKLALTLAQMEQRKSGPRGGLSPRRGNDRVGRLFTDLTVFCRANYFFGVRLGSDRLGCWIFDVRFLIFHLTTPGTTENM